MNFLKAIVLFLIPFSVFGQTGQISGIISDGASGETLISSYIYVTGTEVVEASDFDGKYSIQLEPGLYTLTFTYIGYADKTVSEVKVSAGEVTYLDVTMEEGSLQLDEVVVTAEIIDKTENSVLLLRKKSDQIQDGLSSQEMRKFSVGSVASAVTKVTAVSIEDGKYVNIRGLGDRYSITQLNGLALPSIDPYRNSAQLDLIPTNLLDNIITSKTFSADQPGNFAGGNLNIKTKSFPEQRTFNIGLSMGFNPQNNLRTDFLTHEGGRLDGLGYGTASRARPASFLDPSLNQYMNRGAYVEAKLKGNQDAAMAIDQIMGDADLNFVPVASMSSLDHGISFSYGNSWNTNGEGKLGVILAGSYKTSYTNTPDEITGRENLTAGNLENLGDYVGSTSTINPVVNGMAGIAYKFNGLNSIDLKLIYNHNTDKTSRYIFGERPENIVAPVYFEGRSNEFVEREMLNYQISGQHVIPMFNQLRIEWAGNYVDASMDSPDMKFFSNQYNSETGLSSIPQSNVDDPLVFWRDLNDQVYNGKVDFELPLKLSFAKKTKIKFGGLYSSKNRDFNEFRYLLFSAPDAERFNGDFESYLSDSNTGLLSISDSGSKSKFILGNYLLNASKPKNSYEGVQGIAAGYVMTNVQFSNNLKAVLGVRYESTDIFVESKDEAAADSLRLGEIEAAKLLPSVNLIYSLGENMNLRGSYNHTLARPNLREIAPFEAFDPLTGDFIIGNPRLENTNIKNADFRWELFLKPGDLISAGVFYKHFDNPIVQQYLNSSLPERQFANVEEGEIYGIEFEVRKDLGDFAGFMKNLKANINLALIQSSTKVNDLTGLEPTDRTFVGQAPIILNGSLSYSLPEFNLDANLAYNYTGTRLAYIGRQGTPDVYEIARHQLDFSLAKKLGVVSLAFNAKNILNGFYTQSRTYNGQEYIYSKFKRGMSFGLSLTYNL